MATEFLFAAAYFLKQFLNFLYGFEYRTVWETCSKFSSVLFIRFARTRNVSRKRSDDKRSERLRKIEKNRGPTTLKRALGKSTATRRNRETKLFLNLVRKFPKKNILKTKICTYFYERPNDVNRTAHHAYKNIIYPPNGGCKRILCRNDIFTLYKCIFL